MNPLIRLYGLKCRHGESDLIHRAGILDCNKFVQSERMMTNSLVVDQGAVSTSHIAAQLPANLRQARVKSAMDNQPYTLSPVKKGLNVIYSKYGVLLLLLSLLFGVGRADYVANHVSIELNGTGKKHVQFMSTSSGIGLLLKEDSKVLFVSWHEIEKISFLRDKDHILSKVRRKLFSGTSLVD